MSEILNKTSPSREHPHTREELKTLTSMSFERKIMVSQTRIMEWYNHYNGNVSVSFSGGKDSTVLLDLVRRIYPEVLAVFVNTGLEYPEVVKFVKSKENVQILKPEKTFKQVLDEYGWCFPGKDVAHAIAGYRKGAQWAQNYFNGLNNKGEPDSYKQSHYPRYKFLIDSPFKISAECCTIMKERPLDKYSRKTKTAFFIGTMASESSRRTMAWLQTGCNAFDARKPVSKPLSFWTEQDILRYLKEFKIPYASVYGDIVETTKGLQTTGEKRTGCMFCPIGCHLNHAEKFKRLADLHPGIYNYVMNKLELGKFLDFLGVDYTPYIWNIDTTKIENNTEN
jgi:3'-phosphoadenosine 5'-phosphosulfate sulfotransferase (PAPS reductase)/FAD synthetase